MRLKSYIGSARVDPSSPGSPSEMSFLSFLNAVGSTVGSSLCRNRPAGMRYAPIAPCLAVLLSAGLRPNPVSGCDDPPVLGCGKAEAMARALDAAPEPEVELIVAPREAFWDTDIVHYDLDIEISDIVISFIRHCTLTGTNTMTIRSLSPGLTTFTFRLRYQYEITNAVLNGTTPVEVTQLSNTTRQVTLDRAYDVDEEFTLTISYTGQTRAEGFGSIKVATHSGNTQPVIFTLSEPYYAYTWWPVKDGDVGQPGDNADKAFIDFHITAPNNMKAASNGVLISTQNLGGGRNRYHWRTNYPIAPYLVSMGVANYNTWSRTYSHPGGAMPVEFYIYPGNDTTSNRTAWERVLPMFPVFRTVFGEYPFINEKYGHYNFNFSGGMEHQTMTGLGTFSETTIAHELGHQWWGDMVTCRTWHDIWLNEGFATYSEALYQERRTGVVNPSAYFSAMLSRKPSDPSQTVYVYNVGNGGAIFSSNAVYQKGAWVLHQLRGVVGDATFFQILADYRAAYEGSAATTDDFANIAAATYGQDLGWFFDEWVYQGGAPNYQFGWQATNVGGQNYLLVKISQTHTDPAYPAVFTMPVELRATIAGQSQFHRVWNDARDEWFVVPVNGTVTVLAFDPNQWILRGTTTNVAYQAGPPKIVAASPIPGQAIDGATYPDQLSLWFHTPVNAAAGNFTLIGAESGARSFTLAGGSNVNPVVLNFETPLPPDDYTLTVTGVTAVNSGMTLDGEIADPRDPASLPSGDGQAGGAAQIQFTVTPCAFLADINQDCLHDELDVETFVNVLLGIDADAGHVDQSDLDGSGAPDAADIQHFTDIFLGA